MLKKWIILFGGFKNIPNVVLGLNDALHHEHICSLPLMWIDEIKVAQILRITHYLETVDPKNVRV